MIQIYKPKYTTNGKRHEAKHHTIRFKHPDGGWRTLRGFTDYDATKAFGYRVERLVYCRVNRTPLDSDTRAWLESIAPKTRERLLKLGLVDAELAGATKTLDAHLEDWLADLEARGNTTKHAAMSEQRARAVVEKCGFVYPTELNASRVMVCLADWRKPQPKPNGKPGESVDGLSIASSNHYLRAVKSFAGWLVKEGRLTQSPLAHLSMQNAATDRRHVRRALSAEECAWLIETARKSEGESYGLTGEGRAVLYQLALSTGLRHGELLSLTVSSFAFDAKPPTVTLAAAYAKNRRADTIPLRPDMAGVIERYLKGKPANQPAFGMWQDRGADMVQEDLAAARAAWIKVATDANDPEEVDRRQKSDLLKDADGAGRVVDFHSLRHSFCTHLAQAGVHPSVARELARHSTMELTMKTYTHVALESKTAALASLPLLKLPEKAVVAATGTADADSTAGRPSHNLDMEMERIGPSEYAVASSDTLEGEALKPVERAKNKPFMLYTVGKGNGAPGGTRTPGHRIRNPMLCPSELRAHEMYHTMRHALTTKTSLPPAGAGTPLGMVSVWFCPRAHRADGPSPPATPAAGCACNTAPSS
jgi:integrase